MTLLCKDKLISYGKTIVHWSSKKSNVTACNPSYPLKDLNSL